MAVAVAGAVMLTIIAKRGCGQTTATTPLTLGHVCSHSRGCVIIGLTGDARGAAALRLQVLRDRAGAVAGNG